MAAMLGLIGFGCENSGQSQGSNTQRMQPAAEEGHQDYNERRNKRRSQGGCCGAEELQGAHELEGKTADATEIQVETAE